MQKKIFILVLMTLVLAVGGVIIIRKGSDIGLSQTKSKPMISISSPTYSSGRDIPAKYTCDGENINPPLDISDVPEKVKSLALVLDDPDAPGGNFNHWVMWNIDPSTQHILENSVPPGAVVGTNSAGQTKYFGPCPPSGTHRYIFKVYALDTDLNLDKTSTEADLNRVMTGHIMDQGEFMGKYERQPHG